MARTIYHIQRTGRQGWRGGTSALGLVTALLLARGAAAQSYVNPNPGGDVVVTEDDTVALQFAPATQVTTTANVTTTELIGTLNGGKPVYDQTFTAAFSSPIVQAGVSAARLAITSAGGPGVIIGNPTLVSHMVTTGNVSSTSYVLDRANTNGGYSNTGQPLPLFYSAGTTTTQTFGPATLNGPQTGVAYASNGNPNTGFTDICTFPTTPTTTKPTCTAVNGGSFTVFAGQLDVNVNTTVTYLVDTTTTTTTTTTTADVYDINGVSVQGIGSIHAVVPVAGFDASEGFVTRGFSQANSGDAPDNPIRPWFEYWGQSSSTTGSMGGPGDTRSGNGVDGGVMLALSHYLLIGAGVDDGHTNLALSDGSESGRVHLTQGGLFARIGAATGLSTRIGLGFGGGAVDTVSTISGNTSSTGSHESLRTFWLGTEISAPMAVAGGRLIFIPLLGANYTAVTLNGFSEDGASFALAGVAETNKRTREWAGVDLGVPLSPRLMLTGGLRALHYDGDLTPGRSVSFVNYPAVTGLVASAPTTQRWGATASAGIEWRLIQQITLFASGDLRAQDSNTDKSLRIGLRSAF